MSCYETDLVKSQFGKLQLLMNPSQPDLKSQITIKKKDKEKQRE